MLKEKENKDELLNTLQGMEHELKGIKRKSFKQIVHILLAVLISLIIGLTGGIICGQNWDSILLKIRPDRYSDTTVSEIEEKLQNKPNSTRACINKLQVMIRGICIIMNLRKSSRSTVNPCNLHTRGMLRRV